MRTTLSCSCQMLGEIYGPTGLALRGLYDRAEEFVTDHDCPVHGSSAKAKAARQAWLHDTGAVTASKCCDSCGDDVVIATGAEQMPMLYDWRADAGDVGTCVSCGQLHRVYVFEQADHLGHRAGDAVLEPIDD